MQLQQIQPSLHEGGMVLGLDTVHNEPMVQTLSSEWLQLSF